MYIAISGYRGNYSGPVSFVIDEIYCTFITFYSFFNDKVRNQKDALDILGKILIN